MAANNNNNNIYSHLVVLQHEGYAQLSVGFNEESIDTIIIDHIYGAFDPTFVEIDHEINSPPLCWSIYSRRVVSTVRWTDRLATTIAVDRNVKQQNKQTKPPSNFRICLPLAHCPILSVLTASSYNHDVIMNIDMLYIAPDNNWKQLGIYSPHFGLIGHFRLG